MTATDYFGQELGGTLIEEAGDALFLFDPESEQIRDANPMSQRLSGYTRRQLLELTITHMVRSEIEGGMQRMRAAFRRTGVFHSQEGLEAKRRREAPVALRGGPAAAPGRAGMHAGKPSEFTASSSTRPDVIRRTETSGARWGRSPGVGTQQGTTGSRDHWPPSGFAWLAGGGLKTGQVVGETDPRGERPKGLPYTPQHVLSTLYRVLGFDLSQTTINDHTGRPIYLLEDTDPIKELI